MSRRRYQEKHKSQIQAAQKRSRQTHSDQTRINNKRYRQRRAAKCCPLQVVLTSHPQIEAGALKLCLNTVLLCVVFTRHPQVEVVAQKLSVQRRQQSMRVYHQRHREAIRRYYRQYRARHQEMDLAPGQETRLVLATSGCLVGQKTTKKCSHTEIPATASAGGPGERRVWHVAGWWRIPVRTLIPKYRREGSTCQEEPNACEVVRVSYFKGL